jgi:hypothetical protein
MKKATAARIGAATLGGLLLASIAGAAFADDEYGNDDVDVNVSISEIEEPGVLALTVAGDSTTLTESGSDALVRQFTGVLPTVTVTDTRDAADIPDGAFWYVVGTASAFIGDAGQPNITSDHLGWTPSLLTPNDGEVAQGPQVDTVLDAGPNNVGLEGSELLSMALSSDEAIGSWDANANLLLKVPATVAPGNYTSVLTLSLFE